MDVYYPSGWEGQRLSHELEGQGWEVSTEWASKMPRSSTWSHSANDEAYGGQTNKGINSRVSRVFRFIDNADKDIWNPDPLLSNANVQEFEGWTGDIDARAFFTTVWERSLPTKYMQRADIVSWTPAADGAEGRVVLADGTEAVSSATSVSGTKIPTDRTITTDGKVAYTGGKYLLPWTDGDDRLYHWNPEGGSSTWTLTDQWASQSSLTASRLTDTGRTDAVTLPVVDGKVTIDAKAGSAYVLYPTSALPAPAAPRWGQGTPVTDPGYFSSTLDSWSPTGAASIETTELGNAQALLSEGAAGISQRLHDPADADKELPAGTWSAWAWVEIDPAATREVTVLRPVPASRTPRGRPTGRARRSPRRVRRTPRPPTRSSERTSSGSA